MKEEIICAGFGGQGIMLLGKLIAFGAMRKGLNVTWMPSYGAEVRGGTAYSMVVISDEDIASPIICASDTAIVMNKPSFEKFIPNLRPKGISIVNSSLVDIDGSKRKDIKIVKVPMTDMAHGLGNVRTANMIALGVYIKERKRFSEKDIEEAIRQAFCGERHLQDINLKAIKKGLNINE